MPSKLSTTTRHLFFRLLPTLTTLLLSAGCYLEPITADCRVAGLSVFGDDLDCTAVQSAVNGAEYALQRHTKYDVPTIHRVTDRWAVEIHGSYNSRHLIPYQTDCDLRDISLDTLDQAALTHELAHAMDNCSTPTHEGWAEAGIYAAIQESSAAVVR